MKKSASTLFIMITMMMIILGSSISIMPAFATTPPHKGIDYSNEVAWQQEHLWNLGKDLVIGNSYTYRICDPDAILNYSAESYHFFTKNLVHNGSLCYTIQMDFVNLISTDENQINGDIWIAQATITDDFTGDTRNSIFHVDAESFEVRSADTIHPDTIRYADSIEDTIFSIHKYTAIQSKLLQPGVSWGEVTEYNDRGQNPYMLVLDKMKWDANPYHFEILKTKTVTEQKELDVFSVGYEVDIVDVSNLTLDEKKKKIKNDIVVEDINNVTNYYLVNSHLPFPVSGLHYNPSYNIEPHKEYEFELITYLETSSNRPPQVPVDNDDVIVDVIPNDLPVTERGTIKLIIPDAVVAIPDDTIIDDPIPDGTVTADDYFANEIIVSKLVDGVHSETVISQDFIDKIEDIDGDGKPDATRPEPSCPYDGGMNTSRGIDDPLRLTDEIPTKFDWISKNPHREGDRKPDEDYQKRIFCIKPDKSLASGKIIKKNDGTFTFEGEFEVDRNFKNAEDLTQEEKDKIKRDIFNPNQAHSDEMYSLFMDLPFPELKDNDADADFVSNTFDNCPSIPNPDQTDVNKSGIGDTCENTYPISIWTDNVEYEHGDIVSISINLVDVFEASIPLTIRSPEHDDKIIFKDNLLIDEFGKFKTKVDTSDPEWNIDGTYIIESTLQGGQNNIAKFDLGDTPNFEGPGVSSLSTDGSTITRIWIDEPKADTPLKITYLFQDSNTGIPIEHMNFSIITIQEGKVIFEENGTYSQRGLGVITTTNLSSNGPVDIDITLQGVGVTEPFSGPVGAKATFIAVVPEFGTMTMMVLAAAIVSIVAVTAKSRVIPRF